MASMIHVDLGEYGDWTGTIHAALAVLQRPASGPYAMRLKATLATHADLAPEITECGALVAAATELGSRLLKLAYWSDNQHDAGWHVKAKAAGGALLSAAKAQVPVKSELSALLLDGEHVASMSASGGAKRCAAEWARLSAEAEDKGEDFPWQVYAPMVKRLVWAAMRENYQRRKLDLESEVEEPRPWDGSTPSPCGGISPAIPADSTGWICGCSPAPDPLHAVRAGYRARRQRKAHWRRVRASRVVKAQLQQRVAELPTASTRPGYWQIVLAAKVSADIAAVVNAAQHDAHVAAWRVMLARQDSAHVVEWRRELARRNRAARQAQAAINWRHTGLLSFDGSPRLPIPYCDHCNMALPLRLASKAETECPHCLALLSA